MGGNWELLDGKMGMGFEFKMGMGIMLLKWEGFGRKNLLPHISSLRYSLLYRLRRVRLPGFVRL